MGIIRNVVFALVVAAIPTAAWASVTSAEPAPPVAPHRHWFEAANGEQVWIGPNFCEMDVTSTGFAQFHANVHISSIPLDVHRAGCP